MIAQYQRAIPGEPSSGAGPMQGGRGGGLNEAAQHNTLFIAPFVSTWRFFPRAFEGGPSSRAFARRASLVRSRHREYRSRLEDRARASVFPAFPWPRGICMTHCREADRIPLLLLRARFG